MIAFAIDYWAAIAKQKYYQHQSRISGFKAPLGGAVISPTATNVIRGQKIEVIF